jgi:hypothetical protein
VTLSAPTVTPGTVLTIRFSSVEPLTTRPAVTWSCPGSAAARVTATRLADGTYRAAFTVAAGCAGTGGLAISARDVSGHANAMVVPVSVVP